MTKGTHLLRSALLALLALAVISGASFAGGDLFDDSYDDCPTRTRLRHGEIADLTVARDSDEEDEVNVSWSATDAHTWGLGPNAFDTSLVVILDDKDGDDPVAKTLSLGTRKVTFDGVATGKVVTVQMAIVVDHADGDYLISDILEQSLNQSLTKPLFSTGWNRITATADGDDTAAGLQIQTEVVAEGMMYYVGYNENFGNYKSDNSGLVTAPSTARLRIGLAHPGETNDERDDVDFDAYIIRITDENDKVVPEGDDVATMASGYGTFSHTHDHDNDGTTAALVETFGNQLVVYGVDSITFNTTTGTTGTIGTGNYALSNVRIVDGSKISVAMHASGSPVNRSNAAPNPNTTPLSLIKVDRLTSGESTGAPTIANAGVVYAAPPDEHRDFPIDTFASDTTYTITAWAINDADEVISPVATLKVRPKDTARSVEANQFQDYKLDTALSTAINLTTTAFTVLK